MRPDPRLTPLVQLSGMVLDSRLDALRNAAAARQASLAALAALSEQAQPRQSDLSPIAVAQAGLNYQRWADARRAEINIRLARQTAEWMEQRAAAAQAFGRAEALKTVLSKAKLAGRK